MPRTNNETLTPIERAAGAIYGSRKGLDEYNIDDFALARAALAAIEEPSDAMIAAAQSYGMKREYVHKMWRAMHKAMMEEE